MADKQTIEKVKAEVVEEVDTSIGLCATCMYKKDCTYKGTSGNPTVYCEEFEVATVETITTSPQYAPHKGGNGDGKDAGKFQGLCQDCLHRESCAYTTPGGIWQCEMYEQ
jgi:hypothetical protein